MYRFANLIKIFKINFKDIITKKNPFFYFIIFHPEFWAISAIRKKD